MPEDILEELKAKEEEMEALINDAKRRASVIKEGAVKAARELKSASLRDMEKDIKELASRDEAAITEEVKRIEEESKKSAEGLKIKGLSMRDKAVEEVIRIITGLGE